MLKPENVEMSLFLKYNIKALNYPTKYDPVPTDFVNPNTVELLEVEVAIV